jgi:AraC-like DNA-binding protein
VTAQAWSDGGGQGTPDDWGADSSQLTAAERSEVWRAEVSASFLAMRVAQVADSPAEARASCESAGRVELADITGTPQEVLRTHQAVREAPSDRFKVCVQIEGRSLVSQDDREVELGPGDLALYDLSHSYRMRMLTPWRVVLMTFPRDAVEIRRSDLAALRTVPLPVGNGLGSVLVAHLQRSIVAAAQCEPAARESMGNAALCLLNAMLAGQSSCASPSPAQELRQRVLDYIRHNLGDPGLTHESVAAAHHVSARTLHSAFAGQQRTVTQTIRTLRLEAIRNDLANPALAHRAIAAVARRWCFNDPPHFSRIFKATFGASPASHREMHARTC